MSRRILFVIESLFPLGPARQLNLLARQLTFKEFDIHIATLDDDSSHQSTFARTGFTVHPLKRTRSLTGEMRQASALNRLITRLEPAIVHAWCGAARTVAGLAMRASDRARLIATELFLPAQPGFIQSMAERKLFCRPEKIIVPHESLKHFLSANGIREHRIVVVPNAANYAQRDRSAARQKLLADFNLPDDARIATTIAPLIPATRLKDLIWATDLLALVRDDFHFVLIGRGPQEWRLRRFAAQTEGQQHVHFAGHHGSAYQHLAGADFYWHSHLLEPAPGGLLAAMTNGIPAVSVYGDGTREIIVPQQTGLAVSYGARDEFARWTKYLIEQADSAHQIATQGKAHVDREFPLKPMIDGYMAVYNWCA